MNECGMACVEPLMWNEASRKLECVIERAKKMPKKRTENRKKKKNGNGASGYTIQQH